MNKKRNNKILYPDYKNGIYLYEYPVINGIKQYIQVRGEDRNNPVILFIHGGPGGSLSGVAHVVQSKWEKNFTVVNWDQRNSGKTYIANKDRAEEIAETGTMEDFLKDTDEIIDYLHTVLKFEKIILMGFSWGSTIGAEYAKLHPEKLLCYIAVGQLINYRDGVLAVCRKLQNLIPDSSPDKEKVNAIIADFPEHPVWNNNFMKHMRFYSRLTLKYIAKHARGIPVDKILRSPFMNLNEKILSITPKYSKLTKSYETMLGYDFRKRPDYEIPVLFIYGEEETVCPAELLSECFTEKSFPIQKVIIIREASHGCFYDQPEVFYNTFVSFVNEIR